MSKALVYIKAALQITFSLLALAIILMNFGGLHLAVQQLLERAPLMRSIKVLGSEVDFDPARVDSALSLWPDAQKSRAGELIHGLTAKEFVRLMYVGQLKNLCEFENPSTEMRNNVALDYELRDKGLTKIVVNPATLESVRVELAKTVAQGKSLDIGYPRGCYDMTLTDVGWDVKTALVKNLSVAFEGERKASP